MGRATLARSPVQARETNLFAIKDEQQMLIFLGWWWWWWLANPSFFSLSPRRTRVEKMGNRVCLPNHQRWRAKWKLSRNVHTLHTRFGTFGTELYAQSVLSNKISALELTRKFIKSALLVGFSVSFSLSLSLSLSQIGAFIREAMTDLNNDLPTEEKNGRKEGRKEERINSQLSKNFLEKKRGEGRRGRFAHNAICIF